MLNNENKSLRCNGQVYIKVIKKSIPARFSTNIILMNSLLWYSRKNVQEYTILDESNGILYSFIYTNRFPEKRCERGSSFFLLSNKNF